MALGYVLRNWPPVWSWKQSLCVSVVLHHWPHHIHHHRPMISCPPEVMNSTSLNCAGWNFLPMLFSLSQLFFFACLSPSLEKGSHSPDRRAAAWKYVTNGTGLVLATVPIWECFWDHVVQKVGVLGAENKKGVSLWSWRLLAGVQRVF